MKNREILLLLGALLLAGAATLVVLGGDPPAPPPGVETQAPESAPEVDPAGQGGTFRQSESDVLPDVRQASADPDTRVPTGPAPEAGNGFSFNTLCKILRKWKAKIGATHF